MNSCANTGVHRVQPSARYDSLDLWRGIACLLVVLLHAGHYAKDNQDPADRAANPVGARLETVIGRMGIGVQLFFVVSGYCIAATVVSARRKRSAGREFFARRFRRIFPPYWAALIVMGMLVVLEPVLGVGRQLTAASERSYPLIPSPAELTASQWIGNLTLTEHWRWHLFGAAESKLHGPAWTLCYEEQFYAVCGILLVVVPRRFFAGVTVVTAITLALVLGAHSTGGRIPSGFFFDGRWLLFAAGVFVYLHLTAPPYGLRWLIPVLLGIALVGAGWFRYAYLRGSVDPDVRGMAFEWVVGCGFALVLLALHRWDRQLMNLRALRPVVFCGRMCYSLYLIHWPVTLVVSIWFYQAGVRGVWPTLLITIPVATAVSILAARLFFLAIERHFLNAPHARGTDRPASSPAQVPAFSDDAIGLAGVAVARNPVAVAAVADRMTDPGNAETASQSTETNSSVR